MRLQPVLGQQQRHDGRDGADQDEEGDADPAPAAPRRERPRRPRRFDGEHDEIGDGDQQADQLDGIHGSSCGWTYIVSLLEDKFLQRKMSSMAPPRKTRRRARPAPPARRPSR
jgi:hypothetical protein